MNLANMSSPGIIARVLFAGAMAFPASEMVAIYWAIKTYGPYAGLPPSDYALLIEALDHLAIRRHVSLTEEAEDERTSV